MSRLVAVTGANGFIGQNVVRHFRDAGWMVRAIVRPGRHDGVPGGVDIVDSRFTVNDLIRAAAGAEVIVHVAGRTRAAMSRQFDLANVEVTRRVVRAAAELGARLVHISSQAAAGPGTPEHPRAEGDPPHPLTAYGRSKLAAEEVVRTTARLSWTIVRPALVYGPADRNTLPLFRMAQKGIMLELGRSPSLAYTFIHVDEIARGIETAATAAAALGQIFALGHPQSDTVDSVTETLGRVMGRRWSRVRV